MKNIRMLPESEDGRIETGTVQFGNDWPGVFIRGDAAGYYAMSIRNILETYGDTMDAFNERMPLENLMKTLFNSIVQPDEGV